MKIIWAAVIIGFVFLAKASAQDATPTPTPHNKYGYKKKADATPTPSPHPSRKKISKDTNGDEATPTPHSSKKKVSQKTIDSDDTDDQGSPTPKPSSTPDPEAKSKLTKLESAPDASLDSDDLVEFHRQPAGVQRILESALALTRQNLTYTYGSADPANGGMDCSGFVYYVLRENGFDDVPRDASGQYVWVRKAKTFQAVLSTHMDSFELGDLRPGDLLFWIGTYDSQKDPPITHTMIYLGTEKATHKAVMVGSTDGRSYDGKSRWGVSVFDFKANAPTLPFDPQRKTHAAFVGYAHIPGLRPESSGD